MWTPRRAQGVCRRWGGWRARTQPDAEHQRMQHGDSTLCGILVACNCASTVTWLRECGRHVRCRACDRPGSGDKMHAQSDTRPHWWQVVADAGCVKDPCGTPLSVLVRSRVCGARLAALVLRERCASTLSAVPNKKSHQIVVVGAVQLLETDAPRALHSALHPAFERSRDARGCAAATR